MALGMGIVFSFLIILIFSMKLSSAIINKFFFVEEEEAEKPKISGKSDAEVALAIAAAKHYSN